MKDGGGGRGKGKPGQRNDSSSPPSHHRSTGSLQFPKSPWLHSSDSPQSARQLTGIHPNTGGDGGGVTSQRSVAPGEGNESKQAVPSVFYRQSGPSLSLFKRHKSHSVEEQGHAKLGQRRGSEPGRQVVRHAARARLPSDPGLKVSEVDPQGGAPGARLCLSPCASKAVRDYFSSHPCSDPESSQQVALALVESHREWLKRCSGPAAEPDLDQLLFAEESYV